MRSILLAGSQGPEFRCQSQKSPICTLRFKRWFSSTNLKGKRSIVITVEEEGVEDRGEGGVPHVDQVRRQELHHWGELGKWKLFCGVLKVKVISANQVRWQELHHRGELEKWKLFCRIGKVKVEKSSLISDSGAQGQLLPPLCTTLSIASLAVHLVNRLDAAQRHVLHKSVKENTWEKNRLLSKSADLLPEQLVGLLPLMGGVQLQREAEGGDEEAASVPGGHTTQPK